MTDPQGSGRRGEDQRRREHELMAELSALDPDDPRRDRIREELITMHLPLVRHVARRYRDRGENLEDLVQVGTVGLIKAVDRFDPGRGVEFSTYAMPTILGEIKRHFRDRTWAVRVPRRLQELQSQVTRRTDELTRTLQRSPTVAELADSLDVPQEEILDALEARHAYAADSLDGSDDADRGLALAQRFGVDEPAFEAIEDREALRPLLEQLPDRERRIIGLRFFQNMSQTQIAEQLGISQMHVSRLLARALTQLRVGLVEA